MTPERIIYELGDYWISKRPNEGFEVWKNGPTASVRVAMIGYPGQKGLDRAKEEIRRRMEGK